MSGLNIKLADLKISDFHAPECCFLWWHTEKNLQLLGALPPDPYQGLCPWTPLGAYCGPQTPASFSSFFTFPQSHVCWWPEGVVCAVQPEIPAASIPMPVKNEEFVADMRKTAIPFSDDCQDRLFRAHGECCFVCSFFSSSLSSLFHSYWSRGRCIDEILCLCDHFSAIEVATFQFQAP